jgi:hypothetical protein
MKLTSQRRTELGSSRASLERAAFVGGSFGGINEVLSA